VGKPRAKLNHGGKESTTKKAYTRLVVAIEILQNVTTGIFVANDMASRFHSYDW